MEQVFDTALRGKPIAVMSNNDGCVISRSAEAKALGITMGQPAYELQPYVERYGLITRSANFALYGDLSRRFVTVLRDAVPQLEVYSVDEVFASLSGVPNREAFARSLRDRVQRWVGLDNRVGVGPSKTIAKAANKLAKNTGGVLDLSDKERCDEALGCYPVADVWGVGRRWSDKLALMNITTAAQLRDAPADLILARFGVVLARTQRELQGIPCLNIEDVEPDRQQIMVSRSFGQRVEDPAAVNQAISTFAIRACEKMRARQLACSAVWVFAGTDPFRPDLKQQHPSCVIPLPYATQDTRLVLNAIHFVLPKLLPRGYAYKRAGVALMDLARPEDLQGDLFGVAIQGNEALMTTLDKINQRFGRGSAGFAASGWNSAPAWGMRQRNVSPRYTTSWSDIPSVSC